MGSCMKPKSEPYFEALVTEPTSLWIPSNAFTISTSLAPRHAFLGLVGPSSRASQFCIQTAIGLNLPSLVSYLRFLLGVIRGILEDLGASSSKTKLIVQSTDCHGTVY